MYHFDISMKRLRKTTKNCSHDY